MMDGRIMTIKDRETHCARVAACYFLSRAFGFRRFRMTITL